VATLTPARRATSRKVDMFTNHVTRFQGVMPTFPREISRIS
jgi:hypothetical protein